MPLTLATSLFPNQPWLPAFLGITAFVSALGASIVAGLLKGHDFENRLSKARLSAAKLEHLEWRIMAETMAVEKSVNDFIEATRDVASFLSLEDTRSKQPAKTINDADGKIFQPSEGQKLSASFLVKGTAQNIGGPVHLWIAIQIGTKIWPKESEIIARKNAWELQVYEGAAIGAFDLILVAVDEDTHREFIAWINYGNKHGIYPEISLEVDRMHKIAWVRNVSVAK